MRIKEKRNFASLMHKVLLLMALFSMAPAMAENRGFPLAPTSKEVVLAASGQLGHGHLAFRVKIVSSDRYPNSDTIYNTYEVERHDRNCTSAIVLNANGVGDYVAWTSQDEKNASYYGRKSDQYPEPIYYYRINLVSNILERRLLGKMDMSGNLRVGDIQRIQLVKYDLDWKSMLGRIRYMVC